MFDQHVAKVVKIRTSRRKPSEPITIRGVTYPSKQAAAEAIGVSMRNMRRAIQQGRLDTVGLGPGAGGCCIVKIRGVVYPSVKAAAKALGISPSSVSKALSAGRPDSAGLGRGTHNRGPNHSGGTEPKPVVIAGITFPTQTIAAVALGYDPKYLSRVLRQGKALSKARLRQRAIAYRDTLLNAQMDALYAKDKPRLLQAA